MTDKKVQLLLWTSTAVLVLVIIYLSVIGYYIRPFQDDFYYYPPKDYDEFIALLTERYNWTGRFTSTTLHLLIGWTGIYWMVPIISFSVMITGIYAISQVYLKLFTKAKLYKSIALFLASALTLAVFLVTPSPYSSIFWLSAAPIHFWSYGLILLYYSWLISRIANNKYQPDAYQYLIMIVVPLIIGMMGEVALFSMIGGVALILLFAKIYKSSKVATFIIVHCIGLGMAFLALFFSHGAMVRRGSENVLSFQDIIINAPYVVLNNLYNLPAMLLNNKEVLVVVLLIGITLGMLLKFQLSNMRKMYVLAGLVTIVCLGVMSLNFAGVYSSARLEVAWDRTQVFSTIVIVGLLMVYGIIIGQVTAKFLSGRNEVLSNALAGIMATVGLIIVILNSGYMPYIERFSTTVSARAQAYDNRQSYIKEVMKGGRPIACPVRLPTTYLPITQENLDLFLNQGHALNVGVMRYYRLPCGVVGY